jgi:hypothetical protein
MPRANGRNLIKHPELMVPIMKAVHSGQSISAVARRFKVGRDTISAAMKLPEAQPFERITAAQLESLATTALEQYGKALKKGKINPNSIPIHAGIFLDKRAGLLSEQGQSTEQEGQSVQAILDDLRSVRPIQVNVQVNMPQSENPGNSPITGSFPPGSEPSGQA